MAYSTFEDHKMVSAILSNSKLLGGFFTSISARVSKYRKERKELCELYSYHNEDSAKLERAQREVNRVWQHR